MIRLRLLVVAALVAAAFAGCKDKGDDKKEETASVQEPADNKAAQDLLARRDALMKSRTRIQEERAALEAERVKIVESGGDTSEVDQKLEAQASEEAKIANEDAALADQMQAFLETARTQVAAGNEQAQVAAREAGIAGREKSVATREERVAAREALLAQREKQLAEREKNTCGVAAAPTTIIQTVDPKGAKYSKRDVEPVLKKARETMSKKGILASDLPAQAAGLEREATKSMADGDYGPARFAAQQLLATVEAQKVDRGFISAKISRLSKAMSGRKLDDKQQKEVDDLFRDATAKYGDGDYSAANRKLNQIWRTIE
jgi:hypothetical protein